MNEITQDHEIADYYLDEIDLNSNKVSIILKVIKIEENELDSDYLTFVRKAILGDSTGCINAIFIETGDKIKNGDVLTLHDVNLVKSTNGARLEVRKPVEIIQDADIPNVSGKFVIDELISEKQQMGFDNDNIFCLNELNELNRRYTVEIQLLTQPELRQKWSPESGRENIVHMIGGDSTGSIFIDLYDSAINKLKQYNYYEIRDAMLIKDKNYGNRLVLRVDNQDQIIETRTMDHIEYETELIEYITTELIKLEDISLENRNNLHLKVKVLSIDTLYSGNKKSSEYLYMNVGDETGQIILKISTEVLVNSYITLNKGDVIEIINCFYEFDIYRIRKQLVADLSNVFIKVIDNDPLHKSEIGSENYSKLTEEEFKSYLEKLKIEKLENLSFERSMNVTVRILEEIRTINTHTKKDEPIKIQNWLVADDSASVYLTLFNNEKILKINQEYTITSLRPKIYMGNIYLNSGYKTNIIERKDFKYDNISDMILTVEVETKKLEELEIDEVGNIEVTISDIQKIKGEKGTFADANVYDSTDLITLRVFDDYSIRKIEENIGNTVEITNCVKQRYKNKLYINLKPGGIIRPI
ncbi:MAG: hypothetical protein GF329_11290 [Candidatus Lokiarchaeota archaeon]|nr:hypothetical protein [Candidatus Lokiarchaeota archaeon]